MEAMFKEILNGNMAVVATLLVMIYRMHKEAMAKIDKLIEVTNKLATANELHAEKFVHGEDRMGKIEDRLKIVAERVHTLSNEVAKLEIKIERNLKND